jgi:hypothetical protein
MLCVHAPRSDFEAVSVSAQGLAYAPILEQLANHIVQAIEVESPRGFNGVHLRAEGDAQLAGFISAVASNNTVEARTPQIQIHCQGNV